MTKNRFMIEVISDEDWLIQDTVTGADYNPIDGTANVLNGLINLLNSLSEENKQLKQAIVETEKMVQSTYDELTKLRCFKKNILRIKHSWDYLMESIQYD